MRRGMKQYRVVVTDKAESALDRYRIFNRCEEE